MKKTEYLHQLFHSHVADLHDVYPEIGNIFICPICLNEFTEDDIYSGVLTDGHIWPTEMRKKSIIANNQGVLLCRDCNNSAGSRGDVQMQLFEKIEEHDKTGELYGIRRVEILEKPGEKPIRMRVSVSKGKDGSVTLSGRLNQHKHLLGSSPENEARFFELAKRSLETQQQVNITVHPPQDYKSILVSTGWITSSYLMAFYTLGYRYICHENFDFIREYIKSSFDPAQEKNLVLQAREDFHIYTDDTVNFPDPQIRLNIPFSIDEIVRLEVCFLKYQISLPILMEPNLFKGFWSDCLKQIPNQPFQPMKEGDSPCLYITRIPRRQINEKERIEENPHLWCENGVF